MTLSNLTYIIFELNAALDSRNYDDLPVSEAVENVAAGNIVPWLKRVVPVADLSLLPEHAAREYQSALANIHRACQGRERRKWGVEKRALCLLIGWTTELIQHFCLPGAEIELPSL